MEEHVSIKEEAKVPPMFLGLQWGFLSKWPPAKSHIQLDSLLSSSKLPTIVGLANHALSRSDLQVDSCYAAYGGLTLLTNCIASLTEIDLIGGAVTQMLTLPMPAIASLPTS
jgi:hypothetical protein